MASIHPDAWVKNVDAKVKEALDACRIFIAADNPEGIPLQEFRKKCYETLSEKLRALTEMFGSGMAPQEIQGLRSNASHFLQNRRQPQAFTNLLNSMTVLESISSQKDGLVSFHDIFESYKSDKELNELVDQLVQTLESIISENNAEITSKIEKDIQRLLDQIKNKPKLCTYEIGAWAELVGRFLLEQYGQSKGLTGFSCVIDGIKLSKKVFDNVFSKYQISQNDYVRLIGIKSVSGGFESLPQLTESSISDAVDLIQSDQKSSSDFENMKIENDNQ